VTERGFVLNSVQMSVPSNEKQTHAQLFLKSFDVFSQHLNDLGCANHYKHKIELNNTNPIYVKQF
jgi:hypothetical protein